MSSTKKDFIKKQFHGFGYYLSGVALSSALVMVLFFVAGNPAFEAKLVSSNSLKFVFYGMQALPLVGYLYLLSDSRSGRPSKFFSSFRVILSTVTTILVVEIGMFVDYLRSETVFWVVVPVFIYVNLLYLLASRFGSKWCDYERKMNGEEIGY